jgi:hypothetical protein
MLQGFWNFDGYLPTPTYAKLCIWLLTGTVAAYKLQKHLKEYVDIQILEKSPELGGTWYENRYPGGTSLTSKHFAQKLADFCNLEDAHAMCQATATNSPLPPTRTGPSCKHEIPRLP